jgi:signal transduction histidine kinase
VSEAEADIREITAELRRIAEELRAPSLSDEDAERLAREAADLVARAGNELDRASREQGEEHSD